MGPPSRRRFLRATGACGAVALSGCASGILDGGSELERWKLSGRGEQFGRSVAIRGETALVGTIHTGSGPLGGAVHAFSWEGDGWSRDAILEPPGDDASTDFGHAVALADDTALVGEPATEAGAAHVFERTGGDWTRQVTLTPDEEEEFGYAVTFVDDGALVGDPFAPGPDVEQAGAVYAFSRSAGEWSQEARFVPEHLGAYEHFGIRLASSGDTVLVGAPGDRVNGPQSGSAYIFERAGGAWTQRAELVPDDGDREDAFGGSVALSEDTALVGAPGDDANGIDAGSAYAFEWDGGEWSEAAKLVAEDGDPADYFGAAVAFSGGTALVGAPTEDEPDGRLGGAVYAFERDDGWARRAKLAPDDLVRNDLFGERITMDGDTAIVGAPGDTGRAEDDPSTAYVFDHLPG